MSEPARPGNPRSTASIAGHPIHPMLIPFPIALFVATLVCDIVFVSNGNPDWANAAEWLVGLGVITGLLAAIFGAIDLLGDRRIRALWVAWVHAGLNLLAVLISLYSWVIRHNAADQGAVQPTALVLSIIVVLLLLVTGWLGGELVFRHRVGVTPPGTVY